MSEKDLGLKVVADPTLLVAVRGMVRSYVANFGFPKDRVDEVVIAVDEACTNAIRHAYGGPCERTYQLSMRSSNGWIEIELRDNGRPAPPTKVQLTKDTTPADIESITPGGLGMRLIYGVFDEVQFTPGKTRGNCILMKLKRPTALAAS